MRSEEELRRLLGKEPRARCVPDIRSLDGPQMRSILTAMAAKRDEAIRSKLEAELAERIASGQIVDLDPVMEEREFGEAIKDMSQRIHAAVINSRLRPGQRRFIRCPNDAGHFVECVCRSEGLEWFCEGCGLGVDA